jgi:hypothetical protein
MKRAWRNGENPSDYRASLNREPSKTDRYSPPARKSLSSDIKVCQFIRKKNGSDLALWRIITTYASSPFISAIQVSRSKFHELGSKIGLLRKEDYMLEPDPLGYLRNYLIFSGFEPSDLYVRLDLGEK